MDTTIYKAATMTLDEDMASLMKIKKNVEMETKDLREKLDMLRLNVQEREARESRIESETTTLLAKSMSLDEELTVEMEEFASMIEKMAALRKKNKAFHSNMIDKLQKMQEKCPVYEQGANRGPNNAHPGENGEDDDEEIVHKPPFLGHHPYFTRSKGPADSFCRQSSDKGNAVMGDNNEKLMQQIAEMRVEMQRRQALPSPGFAANAADRRPPIYFPSSNMDPTQNQASTPVKVGETIEDRLKTVKITRVAASPGSSGTLKKKGEKIAAISCGGKITHRSSLYSQGHSRTSQNSYQAFYMQDSHPNNPPIYHDATATYPNVQAPLSQSPSPNYQNSSPIYPNHPPSYQIPSPYQGVSPNYANVQSSYREPPPSYQVQAPPYQNPHPNYQALMPNYKTNSYPRNQAPRLNNRGYQQMPPPQGSYPPRPWFEKKPSRNFTALAESRTKLYKRLAAAKYIHPVGPKPVDINSIIYRSDQRYAYYSKSVGNETEDCINLKHKIQD
ncbi:uncharacterized protein LOC107009747 [Solanum pennellii]|uniref:Uncharacterized protein LOC107009747 n=1 Tax=Solanum pennellii TaxID=28526 RepID=A0ABM1G1G2_SOLPN|nr:uncharacterized protein LOC107009747 [Solanum pennellii]